MKKMRLLSVLLLLVCVMGLPASAAGREATITVPVELPQVDHDITIKVYVDGELDRSKTTTVDPSIGTTSFSFKGTEGKKEVRIKFDGTVCYEYELDFDQKSYTLLNQTDYPDSLFQRSAAWVKSTVDNIFD